MKQAGTYGVRAWALMGLVLMTGCVRFEAGAPRGAVNIVAHRGASAYAPENTLAAFELAVEQGAHWFELDCTLSKDGAIIVIHDDTVDRTTDGRGAVKDLSLHKLKALDAGSWKGAEFSGEGLPTLGESLDLAKGRIGVYIEIKNSDDDAALVKGILQAADGRRVIEGDLRDTTMRLIEDSGTRNLVLTRKVIEAVRQRDMGGQVVIQSFSAVVCAVALAEAPELRTELLGVKDNDRPGLWDSFLRWNALLGAAGFNVNNASLTEENLGEFHGQGKTVAVWTVDKPEDMKRLAAWGVDGIITNRPDVCRAILQP